MALAAGPFRTSTDSMWLGSRSIARLDATVPSVSPACVVEPPASSIRLKFDVEYVELSIGMPSTTNSG